MAKKKLGEKMNKKGLTTVELLAVITILGLIAIILTPIIRNVVSFSNEKAFKEGITFLIKASKDFIRNEELRTGEEPTLPLTFTCDGTSCKTKDNQKLEVSGKVPTSGKIIVNDLDNIYIDKLTNGTYYVSGEASDLTYTKDETELPRLVPNKIENYKFITSGEKDYTSSVTVLGQPLLTRYPSSSDSDVISRNVWDLKLFNNKIYIASGNYNNNTGPVDLYYYDITNNRMVKDYTFQEEQINRFKVIDNKLVIPGIDNHLDTWEGGYYYELNGNTWVSKPIKDAIHNFDVVKYKGSIFVGIGNDSDTSVLKSNDNGNTFTYVDIYDKNNNKIITTSANSDSTRIYDLFIFKNKLYAVGGVGGNIFYEYDDTTSSFYQFNTPNSYAFGTSPANIFTFPIKEKIEFKDKMIFVRGMLAYVTDFYTTNDLGEKSYIFPTYTYFDKQAHIHDALVYDNELYILCDTIMNGEVYISVLKSKDATIYEPVMYFKYTNYASSFEYDGENFYFGIGAIRSGYMDIGTNSYVTATWDNKDTGKILKVKVN